MIGLVIVSHSAKLAEGVCELARQVAQGKVRIAGAGGTADPENPIGTDAFQVVQAIESVYSGDGVLVLMDLGSAVLSAETALELLGEPKQSRVQLCAAPLVEGAVAAASLAAAGATLAEIASEARNGLAGKLAQLGERQLQPAAAGEDGGPLEELLVKVPNRLGLHARPAAQLVRLARSYRARVTLANVTAQTAVAGAGSINGVLSLGARQGHQLRIQAQGPEAHEALAAIEKFIESGCGDREKGPGEAIEDRPPALPASAHRLTGMPASAGIAIGTLIQLRPAAVEFSARPVENSEAERQRLMAAIAGAQEETQALYQWAKAQLGPDEAGIFDAQALFLEDPELVGAAARLVLEGMSAESAWQAETAKLAERLQVLDDPYLRARAADVTDVSARVLRRLTGQASSATVPSEPSILTAHDVTPSQVRDFEPATILALCLETGSASAHSVILARAMGIPVVAGLGPGISALPDGTMVAVDGERGTVWISPDASKCGRSKPAARIGWPPAARRNWSGTDPPRHATGAGSACWPISAALPKRRKRWPAAPKVWVCCARSFCFWAARPRPAKRNSWPRIAPSPSRWAGAR